MHVCLFIHTASIQYFLKTKINDCNVIVFRFVQLAVLYYIGFALIRNDDFRHVIN